MTSKIILKLGLLKLNSVSSFHFFLYFISETSPLRHPAAEGTSWICPRSTEEVRSVSEIHQDCRLVPPGVRGLALGFCPGGQGSRPALMCLQQSLLVSVVPDMSLSHEFMHILPSPFQTLSLFPPTRFFSGCSKHHGFLFFFFEGMIVLSGYFFRL